MNNIAKNHLSSIAQKGRYGDTELAHVNPQEKSMLESMGGSGTINPKTGLKEYFPWLMAATTALSAYQAYQSGKSQKGASDSGIQAINSAFTRNEDSEANLKKSTQAKKDLALLKHNKNLSDLSFTTRTSTSDLNKSMNEAISKSNLATSGSVKEKESEKSRRIQYGFQSGAEGLMGQLGETMAGIEEYQETEQTRIKLEKERLGREKGLLEDKSSSWYLGKNILG